MKNLFVLLMMLPILSFGQLDLDISFVGGDVKVYNPESYPKKFIYVGNEVNAGDFKLKLYESTVFIIEAAYDFKKDKKGNAINGTGMIYTLEIVPDCKKCDSELTIEVDREYLKIYPNKDKKSFTYLTPTETIKITVQ